MASTVKVEIDEEKLKSLVVEYMESITPNRGMPILQSDVEIMVKTKQNYKADWEIGAFKATVNKTI